MRVGWILLAIALVTIAAGGYAYWLQQQASLVPPGLARANGRIEIERVDVSAKYAGRLAEVRVNEGDSIQKGEENPAAAVSHMHHHHLDMPSDAAKSHSESWSTLWRGGCAG